MISCDVLSVDDEEDFRVTLGILLTLEGLSVAQAASGTQAIEMLLGGLDPAVVLLDCRMPGLSGPETLERMRAHGFDMPAVLISADGQAIVLARQQGFADSLAKPLEIDVLVSILRSLMGPRSSGSDVVNPG